MSIAKTLPPVDPFFMQSCPLCGMNQRMMIRGNFIDPHDGKWSRFPDIGYSFCNCRDIFFTKWENLTERDVTWNNCQYPLEMLKKAYNDTFEPFTISMLDPYFIVWDSPHEMFHWQCRKIYILWDMDSWVNECKKVGFEVVSAVRDTDVQTKTPQHFHVTVRKP